MTIADPLGHSGDKLFANDTIPMETRLRLIPSTTLMRWHGSIDQMYDHYTPTAGQRYRSVHIPASDGQAGRLGRSTRCCPRPTAGFSMSPIDNGKALKGASISPKNFRPGLRATSATSNLATQAGSLGVRCLLRQVAVPRHANFSRKCPSYRGNMTSDSTGLSFSASPHPIQIPTTSLAVFSRNTILCFAIRVFSREAAYIDSMVPIQWRWFFRHRHGEL